MKYKILLFLCCAFKINFNFFEQKKLIINNKLMQNIYLLKDWIIFYLKIKYNKLDKLVI